jgi:hypothetical protein
MVEANSHLKLLPKSILDIYKVMEHIDMMSMGIQYQPYTVVYPHYVGQILGFWVTCGVKNDVIMSWLRLTATSNYFPYPY